MTREKARTAFQKIVDAHLVKRLPDGRMVLRLDRVWGHEVTTPNAILDAQARGCDVVFDRRKIKMMIDHVSPAKDTLSAVQGKIMREWSLEHGIEFLDVGRNGVCHAIIPEKGWILPGEIGIMGDSHTCTHGAFCALTAGVGSTELETGIQTGLWICQPQKVIQVNYVGSDGFLPVNVFSKDLVLALIGKIGVKGATNAVLEIGGEVIGRLSMDARLTITNMAVEAGATSAMMMVDETTVKYLKPLFKDRKLTSEAIRRELAKWNSDLGCRYDQVIEINTDELEPLITRNYSPGDVVTVESLRGKPVDQVYIGSCTNGRLEDLRIAATVFFQSGKSVHPDLRCVVVPATPAVWQQANQEGLLDIFMKAGCVVANPSCGACLGLSCGVLAPGEVCVSTTNRNFPGRMGQGGMVHLASPAVAAATAIEGRIALPEIILHPTGVFYNSKAAEPSIWDCQTSERIDYGQLSAKQVKGNTDFSGKPFYLPADNVDTDQIIPGKYLTVTDKAEMGRHCLEDAPISPEERKELFRSQILVAGENFGCGSSREHAPWALEAAGIRCVVAASFARIFENNMFANGLLCITLDQTSIDLLFGVRSEWLTIDWKHNPGHVRWGDAGASFEKFVLSHYQRELIRDGGSIGVMLKLAAELQAEGKI